MHRTTTSAVALLLLCVGPAACGGAQGSSEAPTQVEPQSEPAATPTPSDSAPTRAELTAEECEANGGVVVGDIGDGAIHRADYRCPSGPEPRGAIRAPAGGPLGVEGSVCCPK